MSRPIITRQEIERILILRERRAALKRQIEDADKELAATEAEIISKLTAPSTENASGFILKLKASFKRHVAWKEIVVEKLGKSYAARVLAKRKPTKYVSLVIGAAEELEQRKAA